MKSSLPRLDAWESLSKDERLDLYERAVRAGLLPRDLVDELRARWTRTGAETRAIAS